MKFDFIIGNPPYQLTTESDSKRMPPIYDKFMDAAYAVSDKVELITPARFLFDAGYTPKSWNRKMLNDSHFKVMEYKANSKDVFQGADIKGGVVITYRDANRDYGSIGIFTKYPELNQILKKVRSQCEKYLNEIISSPLSFKLSNQALKEYPDCVGRLRSSAFTNLSIMFHESEPLDGNDYIRMIGLDGSRRATKYIKRSYIIDSDGTLDKYTVLMAKAVGTGMFGEKTSPTIVAGPGCGYLQTFIGIGKFETKLEAANVSVYVKTKFARAMLGVLKITQDCPGPKWAYVPLQDFTDNSDIDWSKSIPEIDQQLYAKYGLDENEINFIETHVKEMK